MEAGLPQNCKNCGEYFTGKYCNYCGERVYTLKDKSIKYIVEEAFHFLTHFEGNFFVTIKTIFTKPGKYSFNYCDGKRKRYFKPVSLFFVCIVLYLIFPKFQGLNMRLETYVSPEYSYAWYGRPMVQNKMKKIHATFEQVAKAYNEHSAVFSKLFLLILLPLTALVLMVLFYRSKKLYFDHFILATEFNVFMIGFGFLLFPFVVFIIQSISYYIFKKDLYITEGLVAGISALAAGVFTVTALRNFYKEKRIYAILKGIVLLFFFMSVIMNIYKFLLLTFVLSYI